MLRARVPLVALVAAVCLGAIVTLLGIFVAGGFDGGKPARAATVPAADPTEQPTRGAPGGRSWSALYAARIRGVVTVFVDVGSGNVLPSGSGFVADAGRGLIITNSHVVTNSGDAKDPRRVQTYGPIYVQRADGSRTTADIVGYDLFDDIAILHYDPNRLRMPTVPMGNSATVRVGDPVAAVGAPFSYPESLSAGVVSQIGTQIIAPASVCFRTTDAIQTDAPINPGNSGGPLFDTAGRVIGVNSQVEGNGSGVAFAVPINAARRTLDEISATGNAHYAWLGVGAITLTPDIRNALGLRPSAGAQVTFVEGRSAAARAGISPGSQTVLVEGRIVHAHGDVISGFDGKAVRTLTDLQRDVAAKRPGDRVTDRVVARQRAEARVDRARRAQPDRSRGLRRHRRRRSLIRWSDVTVTPLVRYRPPFDAASRPRRAQEPRRLPLACGASARGRDQRARVGAPGHARAAPVRDGVRRRGRRDPVHARPADARCRARDRLARDLRARRVLRRDQGDAQRAAGRPGRAHRRAARRSSGTTTR